MFQLYVMIKSKNSTRRLVENQQSSIPDVRLKNDLDSQSQVFLDSAETKSTTPSTTTGGSVGSDVSPLSNDFNANNNEFQPLSTHDEISEKTSTSSSLKEIELTRKSLELAKTTNGKKRNSTKNKSSSNSKPETIDDADHCSELWFIPRNYEYGLRYKINYDSETGKIKDPNNPLIHKWFKIKDGLEFSEIDKDPLISGKIPSSHEEGSEKSIVPATTKSGRVKAGLPRDLFDLSSASDSGISYLGVKVLKEAEMSEKEREKHNFDKDRVYVVLGFLEGSGLRMSFPKERDYKNSTSGSKMITDGNVTTCGNEENSLINLEIDTSYKKVQQTEKTQAFLQEEVRRDGYRQQSPEYAAKNTFYKPAKPWLNLGPSTHIWVNYDYVLGVKNLLSPYPHVYRNRDLLLQLDP